VNNIESKSNGFESKSYSYGFSNFRPMSDESAKVVNDYCTEARFPTYSNYSAGVKKFVYERSEHMPLLPSSSIDQYGYADGGIVRKWMEQNSPKLPSADLKSEQTQLKSVEKKIESLKVAVEGAKPDVLSKYSLTLPNGMRINSVKIGILVAVILAFIAITLAIAVDPIFLLILILSVYALALADAAPTDQKLLKEALSKKETLTHEFDQHVKELIQFCRGDLSKGMLQDFDAQIKKIDEEPEPVAFNAQRIASLAKREKLVKAKAELESMVEFFKEEAQAEIFNNAKESVS
jgi:hypothetical protein